MIGEIDYINKVCNLEGTRFKGTGLDGPFIGINSMLPSLLNKLELLSSIVLEYDKLLMVYGRKHFVEEGILTDDDNKDLQRVVDAVELSCEILEVEMMGL